MQNSDWSRVGAEGRHRHVPSQKGEKATHKSILMHNSNEPTPAKAAPKADPTSNVPPDCQLSLTALPATALASIFNHLNSIAGFKLAQTCRACATEFAHQRKDFTRKAWNELIPTVTCDPIGPPQPGHSFPEDIGYDTLPIRVKWEENPGSALRRLYAISAQPQPGSVDPVEEMWKQAWPKTLWADLLLCDCNVAIQLSSDQRLQLPWFWLKSLLVKAAYGLGNYFHDNAPQLQEEPARDCMLITHVSLQRPAQDNQMQEIMHVTCMHDDNWSGREDTDHTIIVDAWEKFPDTVPWVHVTPVDMQKVAITGSWCQVLPNASWPLWEARHGCHACGMTKGDNIAVDLNAHLDDGFDSFREFADFTDLLHAQTSVSNESTPLTKPADQFNWKAKRQQAKQRAKVKEMKARGRKGQAMLRLCKSRSSQDCVCQDIDWVIQ